MSNTDKIKQLIDKLNKYSYEYYTLGNPSISDETYDKLYDDLVKLEEETGIILSNSPTQKVGNEILSELTKSVHEIPMLSLKKTKDINELNKFIGDKDVLLMLKLDGLTVGLTYENGELIKGETRGNGEIGEDITHNVKHFSNIPLKIEDKRHLYIVGEAIITYDNFNRINSKLPKEEQYKNTRNLASGTIRQLNSNICKERQVKFIGYNLYGSGLHYKIDQLNYLNSLGFDIVDYHFIDSGMIRNLEFIINNLKDIAKNKDIPIDGLVATYDNILYGESLGRTEHHPKHSISYKFNDECEITILRDVKWQVGRTGVVTPVAIFDTVNIYDTEVSRASLSNLDIFEELKLGIGDELSVTKCNMIIPKVMDNLTKSNTLLPPTVCPCCGNPLKIIVKEKSRMLYCDNDNCTSKLTQKISHYCSRNAMNIEGLSDKTIQKFIDLGLLKSIQDIYYLQKDKAKDIILKQEGFGKKSYDNLYNSIEKSKKCKLENFIFGLGIPNVGLSTAKDLVKFAKKDTSIQTIENIWNMNVSDLVKMKDCGEITAISIYNFFKDINNKTMIGYLTQCELEFIEDEEVIINNNTDSPLANKTVYCTGKFSLKKDELILKIQSLGGIYANGYKKSLDYLIAGGDTSKSGKVDKAKKDGISIMTEEELMNIINKLNKN